MYWHFKTKFNLPHNQAKIVGMCYTNQTMAHLHQVDKYVLRNVNYNKEIQKVSDLPISQ